MACLLQDLGVFLWAAKAGSTIEVAAFFNQKSHFANLKMHIQNYLEHFKQDRCRAVPVNSLGNLQKRI